MPAIRPAYRKNPSLSFHKLYRPVQKILPKTPVLESRGDRPLKMNFEDQLKALIFYHLEEHSSGRHLVQVLNQDDYARRHIAPEDRWKGICKPKNLLP